MCRCSMRKCCVSCTSRGTTFETTSTRFWAWCLGLVSRLLLQSRDAAVRLTPLIGEQSDQLRYLVDQLVEPATRRRS